MKANRYVLSRALALHVYAWARERNLHLSDVAHLAHVSYATLAAAITPGAALVTRVGPAYQALADQLKAITAWTGPSIDEVEVRTVEK